MEISTLGDLENVRSGTNVRIPKKKSELGKAEKDREKVHCRIPSEPSVEIRKVRELEKERILETGRNLNEKYELGQDEKNTSRVEFRITSEPSVEMLNIFEPESRRKGSKYEIQSETNEENKSELNSESECGRGGAECGKDIEGKVECGNGSLSQDKDKIRISSEGIGEKKIGKDKNKFRKFENPKKLKKEDKGKFVLENIGGKKTLVSLANQGVEITTRRPLKSTRKLKVQPINTTIKIELKNSEFRSELGSENFEETVKRKFDLENQPESFHKMLKLAKKVTQIKKKVVETKKEKENVKPAIKNPPKTLEKIRQEKLKKETQKNQKILGQKILNLEPKRSKFLAKKLVEKNSPSNSKLPVNCAYAHNLTESRLDQEKSTAEDHSFGRPMRKVLHGKRKVTEQDQDHHFSPKKRRIGDSKTRSMTEDRNTLPGDDLLKRKGVVRICHMRGPARSMKNSDVRPNRKLRLTLSARGTCDGKVFVPELTLLSGDQEGSFWGHFGA